MAKRKKDIWIWLQDNRLLKAIFNEDILTIYNENDDMVLRRMGIHEQEVQAIRANFETICLQKKGKEKKVSHFYN